MRKKKFKRKSALHNVANSESDILHLIIEAQDCYEKNHLEQANYLYQQVLQTESDNIMALNGLGLIAMRTGMMSLAVEFLNHACEVEPENTAININLALAFTHMARYDDAILHYLSVLNVDENNSEVHGELARLNLQGGHFDLALHHYRYAFYLNPEDPRNLHGIVQLDVKSITADDIAIVENVLSRVDCPLDKRCSFYFALGNMHDACAHYDEAFANYSVANMCKGGNFYANQYADYVAGIIDQFSFHLFEKSVSTELNLSSQPVFIVGMPHSGITQVEKILATHSDAYVAGETTLVADLAQKLGITNEIDKNLMMFIDNVMTGSLNDLAQFHLNSLNNVAIKNGHKNPSLITSTLQADFTYLGFIALLFPNARIIHCRRDPLDICLSCFFHNFSEDHTYASDLQEIAWYYQQYERLMAHWEKVLPIEIHTIDYEVMVDNKATVSKALLEYVGLDVCNKQRRSHIDTSAQVDNDIDKVAVNHWQHYEKYLHILKKTLPLNYFHS